MRILFLDDNEQRHAAFVRQTIGHGFILQARTAAEAIKALGAMRFDLASLDHDLDWQATAGLEPLEETGLDVARFIAAMPPEARPAKVRVHSYNPVGARAMLDTLLAAGVDAWIEPFRGRG